MGAVLSQAGSSGERVVAYFSEIINKTKRRNFGIHREFLAIVKAIDHFRYYLCGLSFMVRTDHSALHWLMTFKEPEDQIAHWLKKLVLFSFTVEHRPGACNANIDAMSRCPCAQVC